MVTAPSRYTDMHRFSGHLPNRSSAHGTLYARTRPCRCARVCGTRHSLTAERFVKIGKQGTRTQRRLGRIEVIKGLERNIRHGKRLSSDGIAAGSASLLFRAPVDLLIHHDGITFLFEFEGHCTLGFSVCGKEEKGVGGRCEIDSDGASIAVEFMPFRWDMRS